MNAIASSQRGQRTVERYWSIFDADDTLIDELVAAVFSPDAEFSSETLSQPVRGDHEIARHIRCIRATLDRATTRHITDVQWVHDTARWCWRSTDRDQTHRGMDIVRITPDGERIALLVVFAGLLPSPA